MEKLGTIGENGLSSTNVAVCGGFLTLYKGCPFEVLAYFFEAKPIPDLPIDPHLGICARSRVSACACFVARSYTN